MINYDESVLDGAGATDYAKYMKTDVLLSLQITAEECTHRDEMLFQITHQTTELWLKLACNEMDEATKILAPDRIGDVFALVRRAHCCVQFMVQQLEILSHMTPWDFHQLRPALGKGSGLESPGWRSIQNSGMRLSEKFNDFCSISAIDLKEIYRTQRNSLMFNLAEVLVDLDEAVSIWRARHYQIAVRTIGISNVGTKGMPVEKLTRLLNHKYFQVLWDARGQLFDSEEA